MATNPFENSRISDGTLQRGAQHAGGTTDENSLALEISDMIEEGGRVSRSRGQPRRSRARGYWCSRRQQVAGLSCTESRG